jgi:hypothetical protein
MNTPVCFEERDLIAAASARKAGYLEAVMNVGMRQESKVCVSMSDYQGLREAFALPRPDQQPPEEGLRKLADECCKGDMNMAKALRATQAVRKE